MQIIPVDLGNKRQVEDFLHLPFSIYRDSPHWVPPLQMDERLRLNPGRFPFYKHSRASFFLAVESARVTGRLAVLDNRHYNEYNREASAFFYLFECENNFEAAHGLFSRAFEWARSRGLNRILGPKGFTPLDGFGLLVKGFEHRPAFGLPYNPAYYIDLIEAQGFVKAGESVSGYLGTGIVFPERVHELAERIAKRRGLRIARSGTRAELRTLIPYIKELYNTSLEGTTGNTPLTGEEMNTLANQLLWLADPKLIKLVMKEDKAVGFLFAYPDVSAALQRTRGRLFPWAGSNCCANENAQTGSTSTVPVCCLNIAAREARPSCTVRYSSRSGNPASSSMPRWSRSGWKTKPCSAKWKTLESISIKPIEPTSAIYRICRPGPGKRGD